MTTITLEGGKYTITNTNGLLHFMRYGNAWPGADDLAHSGVVLALVHEIERLQAAVDVVPGEPVVTMDDAIAAGDGTLHGAIDYWQGRALAAEAARDVDETNKVLADNYLRDTATPAVPGEPVADEWTQQSLSEALQDFLRIDARLTKPRLIPHERMLVEHAIDALATPAVSLAEGLEPVAESFASKWSKAIREMPSMYEHPAVPIAPAAPADPSTP